MHDNYIAPAGVWRIFGQMEMSLALLQFVLPRMDILAALVFLNAKEQFSGIECVSSVVSDRPMPGPTRAHS